MWRQDRLWRVDRKDAAMAQAQALAEERGLQVVDETKIEFVRSSSVSFCDDGAAISEVACRTLSALEPSLAETDAAIGLRSEEHTSELQSLMRISYAVFSLKKK